MITVKEHFGLGLPRFLQKFDKSREFISGVEYEIESIKGFGCLGDTIGIDIVDDHSLRNNGKEFKTHPCLFDEQMKMFDFIHKELKLGKDPFSDRTSIHVHVNVRELTLEEVRQLILLYALFEPLFFDFVGDVRKGSIFCVPLNYTFIPSHYKQPANVLHEKWSKYTAFNIVPMNQFGTVEFRHLFGTDNRAIFETWLATLKDLYEAIALKKIENLTSLIEQGASLKEIANIAVPLFSSNYSAAMLQHKLADSLLDVKLSAGGIK
jgi:hypothetical protein